MFVWSRVCLVALSRVFQVLLRNASSCAIKVIDFGSSCRVTERIYTSVTAPPFHAVLADSAFPGIFKVGSIAAPRSS